jgi:hypothetical protein
MCRIPKVGAGVMLAAPKPANRPLERRPPRLPTGRSPMEGLQLCVIAGTGILAAFRSFPDGAGGAVHTAWRAAVNTVLVYLQVLAAGGGTAFPARPPQPGWIR